ncbi:permease of the major facilitator superfamily [Aspergillus coremiiformis]|uniref:Permease of the major facilitator superfamily n=1 Tax=Aspergillus coremiiformis TaxID=138285 RepID=A0A5N6YVL7_9EURO|nr:permease of the major facilitator superfamily [Aspergillus coremiiformis]
MALEMPRLPLQQLATLAICRFAEAVVLTSIVPYLPDMVEYVGVPKSDVPKWVGFTYTVTATCAGSVGLLWGIISDFAGRKRIIILELTLMMAFTLLFGLSQHLVLLVMSRGLLGLVDGNIGIMRTMIAEMVPEKHLQPYALSILSTAWTLGSGFGPALGGSLAHPAEQYPKVFGWVGILKVFPFALPNIASSCFLAVAVTAASTFLHEGPAGQNTSHNHAPRLGRLLSSVCKRKTDTQADTVNERTTLLGERGEGHESEWSIPSWQDIVFSQPALIMFTSGVVSMHVMAFNSLFPVLLHYPAQPLQGNPDVQLPFKFSDPREIGLLYTLVTTPGMFVQLIVFPWATRRYGILQCLRLASSFFPILYLLVPLVSLIPQPLGNAAVCLFLFLKAAGSTFAFQCCMILLNQEAAALGILGALNGMSASISAFGRSLGPALMGIVFSFGVKRGYMVVPWWALAGFAALSSIPVAWMTESEVPQPETNPCDEERRIDDEERVGSRDQGHTRRPLLL